MDTTSSPWRIVRYGRCTITCPCKLPSSRFGKIQRLHCTEDLIKQGLHGCRPRKNCRLPPMGLAASPTPSGLPRVGPPHGTWPQHLHRCPSQASRCLAVIFLMRPHEVDKAKTSDMRKLQPQDTRRPRPLTFLPLLEEKDVC